jgi:ABC-2 type transport system permease protein
MTPATLTWFAAHEFRLAWRDGVAILTAQQRWRARNVVMVLLAFGAFMHLVALSMVGRFAGAAPDKATLVVITGVGLLSWTLMLSQAMESVTRAFYTRSDLDLILSSPAATQKLFAVRIVTIALSVAAMAVLIAAPFVNVLALFGGPHWLAGYAVAAAMGATAAALAVALTVALFRAIGPRRTRLIAQVVAAVIGAAFVIGLQMAAILSYGTMSRVAVLQSDAVVALAPAVDSIVWWPARAALGDAIAAAAVLGASLACLAAAIAVFSRRFGEHAVAAQSVSFGTTRERRVGGFRTASARRALRQKEWTLLRRDPWLVSQTLMQLLYLLPPALLLWKSFGEGAGTLVLLVPVLVMAAGQLGGGLAWLAISGEDAPDLVASAPVRPREVLRAKIEAVLGAMAMVFAPFLAVLIFVSPFHAAVAALGILLAAACATAIQLWFRAQARRSHFRRRQTSSRIATFAEAFVSIAWAATAGLAAAESWFALLPAVFAVGVLAGARTMRPRSI